MNRRPRVRRAGIAWALLMPWACWAYDPASFVMASKGTMPLILTAPHDGGEALPIPPRWHGVKVRDEGTRALVERTAALIEAKTGQRPYVVIALFSRKFLDANRAPAQAMESEEALPAYRAYHDAVAADIAEIQQEFPAGGVLIDVHGQSKVPDTTFRGTRSGLTVKRLLERQGVACVQGERSVLGGLAARGYTVHPAIDAASLTEEAQFVGGHTVFHYGSQHPNGIDAIQLEFGRAQRNDERLPEQLAQALVVFMSGCGYAAK